MAQVPATSYESTSLGDVAEFTIPFPFLSRAEVFVTVDGAQSAFTWINDGLIQLPEIPELGAIVRRYRSTAAYVPLHQFSQGVPFLPRYVDRDFTQTLYAVQEAVNDTAGTAALALDTAELALDTAQSALDLVGERTQYMVLGPYGPGLYFQTNRQVFSYLGEFYAPGPSITLPYTTTGVGAAEIANFRSVGDATLRAELAIRYKNIFYPVTYGAVGDGVTDDTAAFNLLEAALIANGGGYVVLDRSFNIPAGLDWTIGNLTLDGLGIGEIKSSGVPNDAIFFHDANNLTLKDFRVTVPRANLRSGKFCVLFANAVGVTVSNIHTDGGTVGVWTSNCQDVNVTGCYIDTPKADGIHFGQGSSRCVAANNTVVNSGDDAFSTTYYSGSARPTDIVFADNIVRGTIWGAGVAAYSADRVTITGNNISNTALFGIVLTTNDGGGKPTDCTVASNQIHGACQAETQPDSYWNGTNPALDPPVTSELHKSAIVVEGTDIAVKSNSVSAVTSLPNGLRRRGMMINGTTRAAITGNTFNDINGDGISTTANLNAQLSISGNTFESVLGVSVRCTSPVAVSLSICNNVGGYGATLGAEPYLVFLQNAAAVFAVVANNSSSGGRGIFADGTSTNVVFAANVDGQQTWAPYTPTFASTSGTITTASATGYYYLSGKTVFFKVRASITTNGTGADALKFTLPITSKAGQLPANCSGRESATTGAMLSGTVAAGTSSLVVRAYNNGYPGANGAVIDVTGFYEAA